MSHYATLNGIIESATEEYGTTTATDIAVAYDRGRDHGPDLLTLWMNIVSAHVEDQRVETILDLGCGTGRFSEALAVHFDAEVIGIDPQKRCWNRHVESLIRAEFDTSLAAGESIPLPDNSVDLVFMSMIFHHFENPVGAALECRRVLRNQATCFLRAGNVITFRRILMLISSRKAGPFLKSVSPEARSCVRFLRRLDLGTVTSEAVTQVVAPSYEAYAEKLSAGADSVLASLSPSDFEAGMQALRTYAARIEDHAIFEPIDVFVFR